MIYSVVIRGTKQTSCILRSFHFGTFILPSKQQIVTFHTVALNLAWNHIMNQSGDIGNKVDETVEK